MFSPAAKILMLDSLDESVATGAKFASVHLSYSTTGANEHTLTGSPTYARKGLTWAGASGTTPVTKVAAQVTFDVVAGTYPWIGFWDAVTAGNFLGMAPAASAANARRQFNVSDAADITADTIDSPTHGLSAGNQVVFWSAAGASLPSPLAEGTIYFVIAAGITADVFSVSTTSGGSAVNITASGDGEFQVILPETFAGQGQLQVTPTLALP